MWISLSKNSGCCEDGSKSSGSIKCRDFFFYWLEKLLAAQGEIGSMEKEILGRFESLSRCLPGETKELHDSL